jgi:hypothetical protein
MFSFLDLAPVCCAALLDVYANQLTVSVTVAECVSVPEVPVIVIV